AEDGIRDFHVTGVQTCALPISLTSSVYKSREQLLHPSDELISLMNELGVVLSKIVTDADSSIENSLEIQVVKNIKALNDQVLHFDDREFDSLRDSLMADKIGRASCRERVERTE